MNEKIIWDFLLDKIKNPYGVAALMGNLMAESSLNPANATGSKSQTYVSDADSGKIDFIHDGVAFGLAQWRYWSRKKGLHDLAKKQGKSVGDINVQLEYMWQELQSYRSVFNTVLLAKNIRDASDAVMLRYERPSNTSEAAKQKRANYGKKFFEMFTSTTTTAADSNGTDFNGERVVTATVNVNIRAGDSTKYPKLGSVKAGDVLEWVATAQNGWHAVRFGGRVGWVSGDYSEVV